MSPLGKGCYWHLMGGRKPGMLINPAMPRMTPQDLVQNVSSAEAEQLCKTKTRCGCSCVCHNGVWPWIRPMPCPSTCRAWHLSLGLRGPPWGPHTPFITVFLTPAHLTKLLLVLVSEGAVSVPGDLRSTEMCSPRDQTLRENRKERK